jgi:hypothetical protein
MRYRLFAGCISLCADGQPRGRTPASRVTHRSVAAAIAAAATTTVAATTAAAAAATTTTVGAAATAATTTVGAAATAAAGSATTTTVATTATATVAATAAAATAATTEAARTLFAGTGFVHDHGTAVDGLTVHAVDGGLSFRVRAHFHEAEALGATGFAVHHDLGRCHGAKRRNGLEQRIVAHRIGQITDVQFVTHGEPSKDPEKPCGAQPCVNRSSEGAAARHRPFVSACQPLIKIVASSPHFPPRVSTYHPCIFGLRVQLPLSSITQVRHVGFFQGDTNHDGARFRGTTPQF